MSIPEVISFDKDGQALPGGWRGEGRELVRKLFLSLVILLTSVLSFGLGRLTGGGAGLPAQAGEPVRIEYDPLLSAAAVSQTAAAPTRTSAAVSQTAAVPLPAGSVIASKSGSKYHYPSCPGAKQIKEANKITFASAQAAESAGYTLAANCSPR